MTVSHKMTKAKVGLLLSHPYFSIMSMHMEYIEDPGIETANTNGENIRFNPAFMETLTVPEIQGVIAHEISHVTSFHHTRQGARDPKKWNRACDYAINLILIEGGFTLPKGALIDPKFKGKTAEEIYRLLPDSPDDQGGNDPGGCGGVSNENAKTETQRNLQEAKTKLNITRAAMMAKQAGKLPGGFEHLIEEALKPRVNWREILSRFLTEITKDDYTWKKPNKRYLYAGLYLPTLESLSLGKFYLIVDTSISVWDEMLSQFAGEMQEILAAYNTGFTLIHCDTKVQHVEEVEEPQKFNARGRGGTDFRPGFKYINDQDETPAAVIYLTDGECSRFPKDNPDYPVLWATYNNEKFTPPFGEVIHVTLEKEK